MDDEACSIDTVLRLGMIRVVTREFWQADTVDRFRAAVAGGKHRLLKAGLEPRLFIDARLQGVQGQQVVQGLRDFASSPEGSSLKTAVVVGSALYRLQAARIRSAAHHRVFENESAAMDWLLQGRGAIPAHVAGECGNRPVVQHA